MQHRHSTNLNMHVSIYSPGRQNFKQWKDLRQITPRQCSRRCSSWRESKGRSAHTIHARVLHLHGSWTHHGKPLPWARWCWGSAWCKPRRRQVWRGICSLRLHGVSRLRVLSRVCQRRSLLAHCRRCWDQHHSCRRRGSSRWRRGSCHGEETPRQVPTQSSNRQRLSPSLLFMSKNRTESINVCEIIVETNRAAQSMTCTSMQWKNSFFSPSWQSQVQIGEEETKAQAMKVPTQATCWAFPKACRAWGYVQTPGLETSNIGTFEVWARNGQVAKPIPQYRSLSRNCLWLLGHAISPEERLKVGIACEVALHVVQPVRGSSPRWHAKSAELHKFLSELWLWNFQMYMFNRSRSWKLSKWSNGSFMRWLNVVPFKWARWQAKLKLSSRMSSGEPHKRTLGLSPSCKKGAQEPSQEPMNQRKRNLTSSDWFQFQIKCQATHTLE